MCCCRSLCDLCACIWLYTLTLYLQYLKKNIASWCVSLLWNFKRLQTIALSFRLCSTSNCSESASTRPPVTVNVAAQAEKAEKLLKVLHPFPVQKNILHRSSHLSWPGNPFPECYINTPQKHWFPTGSFPFWAPNIGHILWCLPFHTSKYPNHIPNCIPIKWSSSSISHHLVIWAL